MYRNVGNVSYVALVYGCVFHSIVSVIFCSDLCFMLSVMFVMYSSVYNAVKVCVFCVQLCVFFLSARCVIYIQA